MSGPRLVPWWAYRLRNPSTLRGFAHHYYLTEYLLLSSLLAVGCFVIAPDSGERGSRTGLIFQAWILSVTPPGQEE
jgi:hypothetical protein